jgi:putative DNA primase/helicase
MPAVPVGLNMDAIPAVLCARRQWVCWRRAARSGAKPTKVPINARTGEQASSTDPATWSTFAEAVTASGRYDGIGFMFSRDDGFVGIDLDACREPETGRIDSWAVEILDHTRSYTEVSPSGRGLHVLLLGTLPSGARKRAKVEMYDSGRFFTITGERLQELPADIRTPALALDALHAKYLPTRERAAPNGNAPVVPVDVDDVALLERARAAASGAKFVQLYDYGDWQGAGYPSQSEADLSLCASLAFWTGRDATRIDQLFRASGLMRRKWDERRGGATYGAQTIALALESPSPCYNPGRITVSVR